LTNVDENPIHNLESLGWDELVSLKRKLSRYIKELTSNLIEVERNQSRLINDNIHKEKNMLNTSIHRSKEIQTEIQSNNSQLYSISEKLSQSKNFLSMMESRVPSEKEEDLLQIIQANQILIDQKNYKKEREKDEILTSTKEASMKIEAIKAIRTIKEQSLQFGLQSKNINKSLKLLDEELRAIQTKIAECNSRMDILFDSKRQLAADHEMYLKKYNETITQLDMINARLNIMAEMRKKQRQEYGQGLPNDVLFKVKETAKKKLESGSKLSFEELKLLYSEKGY
jgi:uncharacterized coiled-coil DUF342 family protein